MPIEMFGGYNTEIREKVEEMEKMPALRNKVKEEKHLEIQGGLRKKF